MLTVRDVMTTTVTTFTPQTTIREAIEALTEQHLSGAPVLSGKKVAGVVSLTDLLAFIVSAPEPERTTEIETVDEEWRDQGDYDAEILDSMPEELLDEWVGDTDAIVDASTPDTPSLLDQHVVEEAMTAEVISVKPDASLRSAATIMRNHKVHRLVVMEGKHLAGIVSALDIARAVSERGIAGQAGIRLDPCIPDPSPWIDI